MKFLPIFFPVLLLVGACRHTNSDPTPLLVGTWRSTATKYGQTDWRIRPIKGDSVTFGRTGQATGLPGGWCNWSERYKLEGNTLILTYGEPQCIPFVLPPGNGNAGVVTLTQDTLILGWQGAGYYTKYVRKR